MKSKVLYKKISYKAFPCCTIESYLISGEILHKIKILGPFFLKERILLYKEMLKLNTSSHIFCIVDNSDGHENNISFNDMLYLDELIRCAGVSVFHGAIITKDKLYGKILSLAKVSAEISTIATGMIVAQDHQEAESYILDRIQNMEKSSCGAKYSFSMV